MKRQKKSGTSKKRPKKSVKPAAFELTAESYSKTVEFMPDGSRKVSLSPQAMELLENQRVLFREKFGRDPGPSDPVFFDPDANEPRELPPLDPALIEAAAIKAGVRPELAYASAKTGLFPTEGNLHLISAQDMEEFQAAVEEYLERSRHLDS